MKQIKKLLSVVALVALVVTTFQFLPAQAATITGMSDTMSDQTVSTVSDHEILFTTPTGVAADDDMTITFASSSGTPASIDASLTFADIDLSFDATPDGDCAAGETEMVLAAAPVTTTMGVVRTSSAILTFTNGSTTIAAGSEICIQVGTNAAGPGTFQITNPSATSSVASHTITIGGTLFADSGSFAIPIIANGDVTVTATVDPTITFTLGTFLDNASGPTADGSCELGTLTSAVRNCTYIITTATNATGGLSVSVVGATASLTGSSGTITACDGSNCSVGGAGVTASTEEYGFYITSGGAHTISGSYATNAQAIPTAAAGTEVLSYLSPHAASTSTVTHAVAISGITPAGSYSQTLTYTAVGNF